MQPRSDGICVFSPSPLVSVMIEAAATGVDAEIHFHPAGQGVWIARMIGRLGITPHLCAPIGGESGTVLRSLLAAEEIELLAAPMHSANGVYVHDRRSGERAELATVRAAGLTRHEVDDLYTLTLSQSLACGIAVLTGPLHEGILDAEVIARLARDLAGNDVELVADVSGAVLLALAANLTWLKVSHEELIEAGFVTSNEPPELLRAMRALHERGARNVVISRAEEPALALLERKLVEIRTPKLEPRDHHGAGDSMTAALAASIRRKLPAEEALRLAAAAGALNVTRHGLGTGRREAIEVFARRIEIRPIAS